MGAPVAGKKHPVATAPGRRNLLLRGVQWIAATVGLLFLYPLLRFTAFRVPPKPRLVEVPAPLPLSGVHTSHDFILFGTKEGATAVSRICTHLGCRVNYQQDKEYIECPCHQSRFTPAGERIAGPAQKNLPIYDVTLKKDADGRVISYVVQL
ncbi:MAG: ubiquinol-cytochrome c reductase iron-sulfur subunit [Desulfobulbaceae bacterium]|nr:ubiquinol-cytochrome c reductase iron-sulfur subunit [Desulfobulbaceae bacterium]